MRSTVHVGMCATLRVQPGMLVSLSQLVCLHVFRASPCVCASVLVTDCGAGAGPSASCVINP
jgi:hypothetical protein